MYAKHSLSVAHNNLRIMLRAVVAQLLAVALVVAIGIALFGNVFADVSNFVKGLGLSDFVVQTVNSVGNGTFDVEAFSQGFESIVKAVLDGLGGFSHISGLAITSYLVALAFVFVYRVFVSLTDVATVYQISEFMTSNARRPFLWCFFKKLGNAMVFSLGQFVVTAPLDLAIIFVGLGTYVLLLPAFRYALVVAVVLFVFLYAMRTAFFAFWLPIFTEGEGTVSVRSALKQAISKVVFVYSRIFWHVLLTFVTAILLDTLAIWLIPLQDVAFGVALLISLVSFYYIKCLSLVAYFKSENKQYFVNFVDVEGTERYYKKQKRQQRKSGKKATETF